MYVKISNDTLSVNIYKLQFVYIHKTHSTHFLNHIYFHALIIV